MSGIDRTRVRRAFTAHAGDYDRHAVVQPRVVARLLDQLRAAEGCPDRILDIGTGTGRLLRELAGLYPGARLAGLDLAQTMAATARATCSGNEVWVAAGDAEALPFVPAAFDLVVSTSTFQWLEQLDTAFGEVLRVLQPGGRFVFALFGRQTLYELRSSYREAHELHGRGHERRTHTFAEAADVAAALARAGFQGIDCRSELEVETHPDVATLLHALKRIGAGNAASGPAPGLAARRIMLTMMELYARRYGTAAGVPATYEVIYGVCRKPVV